MLIVGGNQSAGGYEVDNSLRFDDGSTDYLNGSGGAGATKTKFTFSTWVKRANITPGNDDLIIGKWSTGNDRGHINFSDTPDDALIMFEKTSGSTTTQIKTNRLFRDPSAWYNIVFIGDTTQATASNRLKLYVNGVQETSFGTATYPSQNSNWQLQALTQDFGIGAFAATNAGASPFSGYMSEVVYLDGIAGSIGDLGEFDEDSGIWKPINVSGLTFGTNGFYLPFENSAALGQDDSGNGNNFTVNNLTSIDQTTDTPTNNFATLNGLNYQTSSALSEGNTKIVGVNADQFLSSSNIGVSSGKWYVEAKMTALSGGQGQFGITGNAGEQNRNNRWTGQDTYSYGLANNDGLYNNSSIQSGTWTTYTTNDIISIALDLDNNLIYFYKNGTVMNSGTGFSITDPANQPDGNYFFAVSDGNASFNVTWEMNFGNPPFTISSGNSDANGYGNFEYAVPSGYYALCTKNLAEYG